MAWTLERRREQSERLRSLKSSMTPIQKLRAAKRADKSRGIYWTEERRKEWAASNIAQNLVHSQEVSSRGGKNGWTPLRRAEQGARMAKVRISGEAAKKAAKDRESRKRIQRYWTPEKRAAFAADMRKKWTPERRRTQSLISIKANAARRQEDLE